MHFFTETVECNGCGNFIVVTTQEILYCLQSVASKQPNINPVNCEIWAVMQCRVYHRQTHSVDELKRRLIDVWCGLEQSIFAVRCYA